MPIHSLYPLLFVSAFFYVQALEVWDLRVLPCIVNVYTRGVVFDGVGPKKKDGVEKG